MILNLTADIFHCAVHKYCLEIRVVGEKIMQICIEILLGINYQTDKRIGERQIKRRQPENASCTMNIYAPIRYY